MDDISTDFVADRSSRFPFRARANRETDRQKDKQTNRQTDVTDRLTAGMSNEQVC